MAEFEGFTTVNGLETGDQRKELSSEEMMEIARPHLIGHLVSLAQAFSAAFTKEQIIQMFREAVDEMEKLE